MNTNKQLIKSTLIKHNAVLAKNHLVIKQFNTRELDTYLSVIKDAFQTVADDLQMTKGIFPASGAFFDKNGFMKLINKGAELFGLYLKVNSESLLVGCVAINRKDGRKFKIMKLAILPSHRSKGYGSYLMDFAEDYILNSKGQAISLGMVSENEVLKEWYLARNYRITKTSTYKKTNYSICFMEKKLGEETALLEDDTKCSKCEEVKESCKCHAPIKLKDETQICLVTHENEKLRWSNTGTIISDALPSNTKTFYWSRVEAPKGLLELLQNDDYYPILVFPVEDESKKRITQDELDSLRASDKKVAFILLDGTWKEARKILRKSDYLLELPYLALENLAKTRYTLRRNKDIDHICTVEVAMELLKLCNEEEAVKVLDESFIDFLNKH